MEWLITNVKLIGALASIAGCVLGLPALLIALIQLSRTMKAAKAAEAAASEALQRISSVVAVASIEQICSRSRDLLHLIRSRDLNRSATAAFELRDALAKFYKTRTAIQIQAEKEWHELLSVVGEIHDALESAAAIRKIDLDLREEILRKIAHIHSQLSMLAAVASEKAGGIDVYSQRIP